MLIHQNTSPIRPARVVLLGASGFLAPVIREMLAKDDIAVRAIGRREIDLISPAAADLLPREITPDDVVVMAAALTPDKGRDVSTLMKNLSMAENVCAALDRVRPAQVVYISSDAVYDGRFSSLLNEESTCEPADLYSLMHVARERILGQVCGAAKIPLAIVRPCAIFGPGDTHNSYGPSRFVRTAKTEGKITLFGGGEEKRHHIYVGDVAALVQLCIFHRSTGVINAVTGTALSFAEIAESVAAAVGAPVVIERLPRAQPVAHRHFDTTLLTRVFPAFQSRPFCVGLTKTIAAVSV